MTLPLRRRDSGNALLDVLPDDEYALMEPWMKRTSSTLRQVIASYDVNVLHVHFPTTALLSLLTIMEDDDPIEIATVGREGFVGIAATMGVMASPNQVICQMAGDSLRLPVATFLEAMARGPTLARVVHRYIAYSIRSAGQLIACNALHSIEARASRWLLTIHDQAGRDDFPMTQEFLAFMLGVRRQSVTVVARALQDAGLIGYHRGLVVIRDRDRLEKVACHCYPTIRDYYDRVMS